MKKHFVTACVFVFLVSLGVADTLKIASDDAGWYRDDGYHFQTNSILVGVNDPYSNIEKYEQSASFLVFSIPELDEEIVSVSFSLELALYGSVDPTEDIYVSAISTPVAELMSSHTGTGLTPWIYEDLTDGPQLGMLHVDAGLLYPFISLSDDKGPIFTCTLNEAGTALVQEAEGGLFAIGLNLMNATEGREEYVRSAQWPGDSQFWIHHLEITTIPEPSTMVLLLVGLGVSKRKK